MPLYKVSLEMVFFESIIRNSNLQVHLQAPSKHLVANNHRKLSHSKNNSINKDHTKNLGNLDKN